MPVRKCAHPGCNAKVLKNVMCEHHRDRKRDKPTFRSPEMVDTRRRSKQRRARNRLASGALGS